MATTKAPAEFLINECYALIVAVDSKFEDFCEKRVQELLALPVRGWFGKTRVKTQEEAEEEFSSSEMYCHSDRSWAEERKKHCKRILRDLVLIAEFAIKYSTDQEVELTDEEVSNLDYIRNHLNFARP